MTCGLRYFLALIWEGSDVATIRLKHFGGIAPTLLVVFGVLAGLCVTAGSTQAQVGTVSGQILSQDTRQPVSAAQVFIGDLDLGVLSEQSGRYTLQNVPPGTHEVSVARLGYGAITQEIVVGAGQTVVFDFELVSAALELDEIIVTGTAGGTQRRAVGNVVARIEVDPLQRVAPINSLEQAIGASVPGLVLFSSGSMPGQSGADIRIRGSSSQALTNAPIVYIDGIRMEASNATGSAGTGQRSRLDDINPEDIESVEIIKGPAAATLYGTEASNGVIQIITKRGEQGAPVFDASIGGGVRWLHNPMKVFGTVYGTQPVTKELMSMNVYESEERRLGFPIFTYGKSYDYDLSVRGGTPTLRYFVSGARGTANGIRDYNFDTRTSMRTSLSFIPREDLDIRASLSYNIEEARAAGSEYTDMYWSGPDDRLFEGGVDSPNMGFFRVPPEERRNEENTLARDRTNLSTEINYRPRTWFANRLVFGRDLSYEREGYLLPRQPGGTKSPYFRSTGDGRRQITSRRIELGTFDYNATISASLTDNLSSSTSFGLQYYSKVNTEHRSQGDDFATSALTTVSAAGQNSATEMYVSNTTVGYFVQEQLDWGGRIFVTAAVRQDDNSAFGSDFSAATYPKASATWVMSDEGFWSDPLGLNTLRLRAAWGQAGQQPDVFAATRLYQPMPGPGFIPILTPQTAGNPDLGPEKGEELELGFDATLFNDRVSVEFTGYWRDTKDAIVTKQLAPSLGIPGTQLVNVGGITSNGTETAIGLQILTQNPVRWDIQASFASQNNKIVDLGGPQVMIPVRRARHHIEGFPLAAIFGYEIHSAEFKPGTSVVNKDTWLCDGGTGQGGREIGGAAVNCSDAPLLYQGSGEPHFIVNLQSTWTLWEDFQIYGSIDGLLDYWSVDDGCAANHLTVRNSLKAQLQDDPLFVAHMNLRRQGACEYKNGFLKVREVGFRYTFADELAARMGADRASFSVGARNLNTLYRAQEMTDFGIRIADPEGYLASENFGGETRLVVPPQVLINATLRVSF